MANEYHNDDAINAGYEKAHIESLKEKFNLERNRYKQDCRKRALDLAASNFHIQGKTETPKTMMGLADEYYNWLINLQQ